MRTFYLILLTLTTASLFGQVCPADFTFSTLSCNEIQFVPTSAAAGTYKWTFGDGTTSTERAPKHIFNVQERGIYEFSVTLITAGNCVPDTVTRRVSVSPRSLPDASIESVGIHEFVNCAPTDDPSYELVINNTSSTESSNTFYRIDWGDGSTPYAGADLPDGTSHTYFEVGLYDILLSVRGADGCWSQETFPFFYGSNPGGNIVPVSNQIACVPEDIRFTISGTDENPPGTTYKLWVNDGVGDTTYFNHPPPSEYVYHLTTSPCQSSETAFNYYEIHFEATNPCFTQSGGTIIRANKVPKMDFDADETTCVGGTIDIRNNSEPALYAVGNTCSFDMLTEWSVSADTSQYEIVEGSMNDEDGLKIRFKEEGEYTVTLNYSPRYSNACTSPPLSKQICVLGPPTSGFDAVNPEPESCTPLTIETTNTSNTAVQCGDEMTYLWTVDYLPANCGASNPGYTLLNGGSSANPALTDQNIRIRFDSSGQYRLGLVATNECGSDTSYQDFTVAEAPLLAIREIADTCFFGPVGIQPILDMNFDCSDPPVYSWDFDGGTGGDPDALIPGTITYDKPGTYTISVMVRNGCGTSSTSETFEIFGEATLPTISVTQETCESSTIEANLQGRGANMTFRWTGPDGFESNTASWVRSNATPAMGGTYTVIATNSEGCSTSATYDVVIEEQAPIEVVAGDADVCIGESVTLEATGGATYTWTGDHLSGSSGSTVTFSHDAPGDYTVVVYGTDPAGRCDATDTITVTVHDIPVADAGPAVEACVDQEIELNGTPAGRKKTGRWTGDYVSEDGTFLSDTPGTYTLTYTFTAAGGCTDSDQTTVCVRPVPVANFTVDPTDACESTGLILRPINLTNDLDACTPAEVLWTLTPDAMDCGSEGYTFIEGTSPSSREPVIELTRTDAYTLTLTVISSCGTSSSSTHSERVMLLGKPDVAIVPVDTLCGAQAITFDSERAQCSSPVTNYVWSFPTATTPTTSTSAMPPSVHYGPGTHTVELTAFTACGSTTVSETFTVSRPPAINVTLPATTICSGEVLTVGGSVAGDDLSLRWTASDPTISFSDASVANPEVSFAGVPAGTYRLSLSAVGKACSEVSEDFTVVVEERPGVALAPIADACDATTFTPTYELGSQPITSVRWELSDGVTTTVVSNTSDPGTISIDRPGTYSLSLIAENGCGVRTASRTFTVHDERAVDLSVASTEYCHDGETEVTIINRTTSPVDRYRWVVTDAAGNVYLRSNDAAPVFTFAGDAAPGAYTITAELKRPTCGDVNWDTLINLFSAPDVTIEPIYVACDESGFTPRADYGSDVSTIDSVRWTFPAGSTPAFSTDLDPGRVSLSAYGQEQTVSLSVYSVCGELTLTESFDRPAPPQVDVVLSDTVSCVGETITVSNNSTGDGLVYRWSVTPEEGVTLSDSTAANPNFRFSGDAGIYTISMMVTDGACTQDSLIQSVSIEETPIVSVAENPDGCGITSLSPMVFYGGDSSRYDSIRWMLVMLSDTSDAEVLYSGGHTDSPIELAGPATYVFTATAYNLCAPEGVTGRDTFTVNEPPQPELTLSTDRLCPGGSFVAADAGGNPRNRVTFHLFDPAGNKLSSTQRTPVIFVFTEDQLPGEYLLRLEVDNGACGIASRDTVITLQAPPRVRLDPTPDVCGPATVQLSADHDNTNGLNWEIRDAQRRVVFASDAMIPEPTELGPGRYFVSVVARGSCGTATDRDTFELMAPPTVDFELSAEKVCLTETTQVTINNDSPAGETYRWSVEPAASAAIDDDRSPTPTFTFSAAGDYVIRAELDNGFCSPVNWTSTVSVRPQPTMRIDTIADYCGEATINPHAFITHASEYDSVRWHFPGSETEYSTEESPQNIRYRSPGTYTVTLIGYGACIRDMVSETFTVRPLPELSMGGRDTICILDGLYALRSPRPAGGYWQDAQGRTGVVSPDGLLDPEVAGSGTTVLAYTYESESCSVTGYREVVVIERPEVRLTTNVLEVCETESQFVLNNGRPAGGWYKGPGVTDPAGIMDPSSLGAGTYTLTYHYRPTSMSCSDSADFTVHVRPRPVVEIIGPDQVCVGQPVTYSPGGSESVSFVWRYGDSPPIRKRNADFTFNSTGIQTIRLTATNAAGCSHTVVKQVRVSAPPTAGFTGAGPAACADEPYRFTNQSDSGSGEVTFQWNFGNGQTSALENPEPVHFAATNGDTTYRVSLRVTNECGTDTYTGEVPVRTAPRADFTLSQDEGCSALEVEFDNQSRGSGLRYTWLIDGRSFSTAATPPARSFVAGGRDIVTYEVMLVAASDCAADTLSRRVTVYPREIGVRFAADVQEGCGPLTVGFTNETLSNSAIEYSWDFGDGAVSGEENPTHTFRNTTEAVRTYTVTLTADNGCAREQFTLPVRVYPAPQVSFAAATTVCIGEEVAFENTSGDVSGLRWDFGDGTTEKDVSNPRHRFPGPGTYTVTLTASVSGADCPGTFTRSVTVRELPGASFALDKDSGCAPLEVQPGSLTTGAAAYLWDFGDGNTAIGERPAAHTYSVPGDYEIRLTVRDEFGCTQDTVFAPVVVHALPSVAFTAEADRACGLPQQVCFTNRSSGAAGYAWDFGNGESTGINAPCVTYTEAGTYNVNLTATTEYGCTAETSAPLAVYGEPVAEFSIPDTAGCTAGDMPFTSISTHTDYINWSFSDGYTTEGANFTRRFDEPGSYDVTIIAGNGSGCADTLVARNFVEVYPRPFAEFDVDNAPGEPMNTLQFTDRSTTDAVRFGWDFGDGHGSVERDPMHRYMSSFDKVVYHWVENEYGCQDTVVKPVELDMLVGLFIHNIFTPDDNTVDEQSIFKPKGIGLDDFYIGVYTRTGQLVWESDELDGEGSPTEAWDGNYQGQPAKPGTYVWRVHRASFRNGRTWSGMPNERGVIAKSGYITLLR